MGTFFVWRAVRALTDAMIAMTAVKWLMTTQPPAPPPPSAATMLADAVSRGRQRVRWRAESRSTMVNRAVPRCSSDIAARFDLSTADVDELRELHLGYDPDAAGEYLHIYTRTISEVFFEFVERVDAYAGYGAGTAPVRLTAQGRR